MFGFQPSMPFIVRILRREIEQIGATGPSRLRDPSQTIDVDAPCLSV